MGTDRRARVNELLGTYHPAHQSTNVPTTSSYSNIGTGRSSSRLGTDYLDTYTSRRMSNVSDDGSPSRTRYGDIGRSTSPIGRSRSPSRYNPDLPSYSGTRSNRFTEDTATPSSSYSSRYTPSTSTSRSSGADEINRLSRNLERSVSSILSGDYRRDRENREFLESYQERARANGSGTRDTLSSRDTTRDNPSTSRTRGLYGETSRSTEPSSGETSSGLSKEEEEAAKKKIGWVDEKEAEKRIGTGWYEKEKEAKAAANSQKNSLNNRMLAAPESEDEDDEIEFSAAEIVARMKNSNVNEYGRDCDKGDVVFLASCQCFRAESTVIKKYSNKLAALVDEHEKAGLGPDSFISIDCSAVILEHLLNSFYNISHLSLENIECLMLLHVAQKYECVKTRDFCIKQLRSLFNSPDPTTALIALDIVGRYSKDPPAAVDSLVATSISYLITTNAFKKIESIKQFHGKIYQMDESVLTQLAIGTAELGTADVILSFCRILNLWAGEQRESCRGIQLRDILTCLRIEDKLTSKEIAQLIPLSHFNENYESLQFLSTAISNVILTKNK